MTNIAAMEQKSRAESNKFLTFSYCGIRGPRDPVIPYLRSVPEIVPQLFRFSEAFVQANGIFIQVPGNLGTPWKAGMRVIEIIGTTKRLQESESLKKTAVTTY